MRGAYGRKEMNQDVPTANHHTRRRRGTGTVREMPNGRFRARITCGHKVDGTRRTATKVLDTREAAEAWLARKAAEMGSRADVDAGLTLSALWELYVRERGERLARKTMSAYRSQMRVWLAALGGRDVSRIECADVQRELDRMTHENALHAKRVLSSVLTYAVGAGLLRENPLLGHRFEIPEAQRQSIDYDLDPFAAIEGERTVWDVRQVVRCFELIRGLPLEVAWLACVGAGLRVEEALALRGRDVRRSVVAGVEVTQLAVHHATTALERRKATKTARSVRVASMLEPFGSRFWELARDVAPDAEVCGVSASGQNRAWRSYFAEPPTSKHARKSGTWRGRLRELPYLPLARMRNTHATLIQQAGVLDSINAAMHGHSERVSQRHYLRPDTAEATVAASERLRLVG